MPTLNDGRTTVLVTTNKTLTAADQGIVQVAQGDGIVFTVPPTAAGLSFTFRNGGLPKQGAPVGTGDDGSVGFIVRPQASDGISGLGFSAQANKGAVNTKATSKVGDELHLIGSGVTGAGAWNTSRALGLWAREA